MPIFALNEAENEDVIEDDRPDLERLHSRDAEAFNDLYGRHARAVRYFIYGKLHRVEDVDELLQDTFMALWESPPPSVGEYASLRSWLFTIARRRIIDRLRKSPTKWRKDIHVGSLDRVESESGPIDVPDPFPAPDEEAMANETHRKLMRILFKLPSEQLDVVREHYYGDEGVEDIAARKGIPIGTVKSRLRLARTNIFNALDITKHHLTH